MAGYTVYWAKDYIKQLQKAGDTGPLCVVYGSHHTKMPSISSIRKGDTIYPITIMNGQLHIVAKLPVEKIEPAMDYLVREVGELHSAMLPEHTAVWSVENGKGYFKLPDGYSINENGNITPDIKHVIDTTKLKPMPHMHHQKPQTCCAKIAASGEHGTAFRLTPVPEEYYPQILLGQKGKETPMKLNASGEPAIYNISGFTRHMHDDTQKLFEALLEKE